jgi:F0F1-type ATP synthase assembly protein I
MAERPPDIAAPATELRSLLRAQFALALIAAAVGALVGGRESGISALWGGGIAFGGTLLAALVVVGVRARTPGAALAAQLGGEGVKIVWTIAMFWVALRRPEVRPLPLFAGFCVTLLGFFVGPLLRRRRQTG